MLKIRLHGKEKEIEEEAVSKKLISILRQPLILDILTIKNPRLYLLTHFGKLGRLS